MKFVMKRNQNIMKGLAFTFIATSLSLTGYAQQSRLKYADKMYANEGYYYASEAYEDVLARKTDSATVAVKLADSYDKLGDINKAAAWYRYLKRNNNLNKEQLLRLALLERQLSNYDESKKLMDTYVQKYGQNDVASSIVSASTSIAELQNKKWFDLKPRLSVNTPASEMGLSYFGKDNVLIASSKRQGKSSMQVHSWTGQYYYSVFKATIDASGNVGKKMKAIKKIDEKFNDGPVSFNEKNNVIYFSRNAEFYTVSGNKKSSILKLYKADYKDGKFKNVKELGINGDDFSCAHPSVSKDGKRLYFASNRSGGMGGMDIYYVNLDSEGNTSGSPVNLGPKVNTSENDMFPYFNSEEGILFFASEGHFGLGGLDVFVSRMDKAGMPKDVENLGSPVNGPYDDFSFVNNATQTNGFFSSNRPGGSGSDDIYAFNQLYVIRNRAVVNGSLTDLITNNKIDNGTIYLADKNGNVVDSVKSSPDGKFNISLAEGINDEFKLIAKKDGYNQELASIPFDESKGEYAQDLKLMPILNYYFVGTIKDKANGEIIKDVKVTITDLDKNQVFETVQTASAGDFKTKELPYGYKDKTSYRFKIEKDGYVAKTVDISSMLDTKEEIVVNDLLNIDLTKIEVGKTDLNEIVDIKPIFFDFNKADIRPDAAIELNKVVAIMKDNPKMVIELRSFTDNRGSKAYNKTLSDKRAKSSAKYIVSQGIGADRIAGKGYGADILVVSDAEIAKAKTEEEKEALHQKNRRTEFIIVKMK